MSLPADHDLSVIIPCYNRARLIGATLENLLAQTVRPREIIVVDDGSSDGSAEVVRGFGGKVKLIQQSNRGPGAARNTGFAASSGAFVQFFDSDDLASRNKLEVQLRALQKHARADFAYGPWTRVKIVERNLQFDGPIMQSAALPAGKPMLEWQLGSWCLVFQNCLFRRAALEQAGSFRTDLMPTEDSEYLVRILAAGAQPIFTPQCLVFYRMHEDAQITSTGLSERKKAEDWTHYYEAVGNNVAPQLKQMRRSTRLEIALLMERHLRACEAYGWPAPALESPFHQLHRATPRWQLQLADFQDRLTRKLRRLTPATPNSIGLQLAAPGPQHHLLAIEAGFNIIPNLACTSSSAPIAKRSPAYT